jgi:hypothetical protein
MNGLTKNKVAAILIALYTLPGIVISGNWIVTDSPMISDMGIGFALSGFATMLTGLMTVFGVWQDQKGYKIIAIFIFGVNALGALPGILFAPTLGWRLSAIGSVAAFVVVLVLLLRRTPQSVPA